MHTWYPKKQMAPTPHSSTNPPKRKQLPLLRKQKKAGDTLAVFFEVIVSGVARLGLGRYVQYDRKLDGMFAQALMSIQAIKGVRFGEGFANAAKFGFGYT